MDVKKEDTAVSARKPPVLGLAPSDVQEFVWREARLLNERRFEEWLELFAEDAIYWVPERPGQQDGERELSLAYYDTGLLRSHVARLRHPRVFSQQPPSLATRVVSNILAEMAQQDGTTVHATFVMLEYRNFEQDRKSTRLNSSHIQKSRMPSSA